MLVRQPKATNDIFRLVLLVAPQALISSLMGVRFSWPGLPKCARTPVQTTGSAGQHGSQRLFLFSTVGRALTPIEFLLRCGMATTKAKLQRKKNRGGNPFKSS